MDVGGTLYVNGTQLNPSSLVNYWQLNNNVISPANSTQDLAIGSTATSSAKFQVFALTNGVVGAGTASTAADLTFNGTQATAHNINVLGNKRLDFRTSPGGDAGLASQVRMSLTSNGNLGIGSTAPTQKLDISGNIAVSAASGIDTNAAGVLNVGNTTATTVNIGNTAATTLALGAGGALTRTINIWDWYRC